MTNYLVASTTALVLLTSSAFAQSPSFDQTNSAQPNLSTNGAAGTYDMTKTQQSVDAQGVRTGSTETFNKSQSYASGQGAMSAKTSITTSDETTTTLPKAVSATTTTTITTREIKP